MKQIFAICIFISFMIFSVAIAQSSEFVEEEMEPIEVVYNLKSSAADLDGVWEVNYIYDKFKPFEELFPARKPILYFDIIQKEVFGFTGCNNFSIFTEFKGNGIDVMGFLTMTKLWCDGDGEDIFLTLLKSAHTFSVDGEGVLSFKCGNMEIMKLTKIEIKGSKLPFSQIKTIALDSLFF